MLVVLAQDNKERSDIFYLIINYCCDNKIILDIVIFSNLSVKLSMEDVCRYLPTI